MTLILWILIYFQFPSSAQEVLIDSLDREIQDSLVLELPNQAQQTADLSLLLSRLLMTCKIELRYDLDLGSCKKALRYVKPLAHSTHFMSMAPFEKLLRQKEQELSIDQYIQKRKEEALIGTLRE